MYPEPVETMDAPAVLAHAREVLHRRRTAETDDLRVVAQWAVLHGEVALRHLLGSRTPGGDRLVRLGGDGTPLVAELALAELAIARATHLHAVRAVTADVLDLAHRLPATWEAVMCLEGEVWVARRIASMTRRLSSAACAVVDAAVARMIGTTSPGRTLAVAEAKIIEADPVAHRARLEAARRRRFVILSRVGEDGLRTVIARVTAGDALWVEAVVDRVADLLAATHNDHPTRDELRSEAFGYLARPAELLALLVEANQAGRAQQTNQTGPADPASDADGDAPEAGAADPPEDGEAPGSDRAARTTAEAPAEAGVAPEPEDREAPAPDEPETTRPDQAVAEPDEAGHETDETSEPGWPEDTEEAGEPETGQPEPEPGESGEAAAGSGETLARSDPDRAAEHPGPAPAVEPDDAEEPPEDDAGQGAGGSRATAFPADLLDALRSLDPARWYPRVQLYVHLHEAAVRGAAGVARVEGVGPMLRGELTGLLRYTRARLTPVIDLNERVAVEAYEVPEHIRERVLLTTPGEYFPHATTVTRSVECDHVTAYDEHGPPDQTATDNLGPLTRNRHRIKTHGGYLAVQTGLGEYVWRTPHGAYYLVDHTGTHPIPDRFGASVFGLDPPPLEAA